MGSSVGEAIEPEGTPRASKRGSRASKGVDSGALLIVLTLCSLIKRMHREEKRRGCGDYLEGLIKRSQILSRICIRTHTQTDFSVVLSARMEEEISNSSSSHIRLSRGWDDRVRNEVWILNLPQPTVPEKFRLFVKYPSPCLS